MCQTHLTLKSANSKTGPIPVSTSSAITCPDACPFKAAGCYGNGGPLAIHWRKVTEGDRGTDWREFCDAISNLPKDQLWRHNQAGDLPGIGDEINRPELVRLVLANNGRRGYTYTHKPVLDNPGNRAAVHAANLNGFTVNLSGNNPAHADQLADLGIGPVTTVLPADQTTNTRTPAGRKVVVCPAAVRDGVSCATCQLCARSDRNVIIGFPAHGSQRKAASAVASN